MSPKRQGDWDSEAMERIFPIATINSLPPELVLKVLHYLTTLDRYALKLAGSRYIASIINQYTSRLPFTKWCETISMEDAWSRSLPFERRPALCITLERDLELLVRYYLQKYRTVRSARKTIEGRIFLATLHWATYYGSEKVVRLLLDKKVRVRCGKQRMTVLHVAAMRGHTRIATLFLENDAEINALDTWGKTPLQLALENHHDEVAALLQSKGAVVGLNGVLEKYPDTWPRFLQGPFLPAAEFQPLPESEITRPQLTKRESAILAFLHYDCAKLNMPDIKVSSLQRHALHGAIIHNLPTGIISMLDQEKFDINTERLCTQGMYLSDEGEPEVNPELDKCCRRHCCFTALHLAISTHNHALTRFLLDRGADATRECPWCKWGYETPLHCAVRYKNIEALRLLLDSGISVDIRPQWGLTALHVAAVTGNMPFVEFLLNKGADINACTRDGTTVLHYAVMNSHYLPGNELVTYLLDRGANVNAVGFYKQTPLHHAKTFEVLSILLARGANVNARDGSLRTRLHTIMIESGKDFKKKSPAAFNRLNDAFDLMIMYRADLNARDVHGNSLLNFGMNWRSFLLSKLVCHGLNPNSMGPDNLPIIRIAMKSRGELFEKLLEHGANVHFKDPYGCTLLHLAIMDTWKGERTLVRFKKLLDCGIDVNAQNMAGRTALYLAVQEGKVELIPHLLRKGADVHLTPTNALPPLLSLYENGWISAGLTLDFIASGADLNVRDPAGQSVLHLAAMNDKGLEVIPILLDHGAEVNARDEEGWTPLHAAYKSKYGDIYTIHLLNYGADINARTSTGNTPLHLASTNDNGRHVMSALLKFGAEVDARGAGGRTPLHETLKSVLAQDHAQILLRYGADPDAQDMGGRTLLHKVVARECPERLPIIKLLVKYRGDPNIRDDQGLTPLFLALERQVEIEAVEAIIRMGADVNARHPNGELLLRYFSRRPGLMHPDCMGLLIYYGASMGTAPIESETDWAECFDTHDPRFVADI